MPMPRRILLGEGAYRSCGSSFRVSPTLVSPVWKICSPASEVIGTVDSRFGRRMREPVTSTVWPWLPGRSGPRGEGCRCPARPVQACRCSGLRHRPAWQKPSRCRERSRAHRARAGQSKLLHFINTPLKIGVRGRSRRQLPELPKDTAASRVAMRKRSLIDFARLLLRSDHALASLGPETGRQPLEACGRKRCGQRRSSRDNVASASGSATASDPQSDGTHRRNDPPKKSQTRARRAPEELRGGEMRENSHPFLVTCATVATPLSTKRFSMLRTAELVMRLDNAASTSTAVILVLR